MEHEKGITNEINMLMIKTSLVNELEKRSFFHAIIQVWLTVCFPKRS